MKKTVFKGLFLTALISNSVSAFAVVDAFEGAPYLTTQNSIYVQEIGDQNGGQYQITNKSNQEIFMFGVTNSNARNAFSKELSYLLLEDGSETQSYWFGKTITRDQWNNTDQLFGAFKADPNYQAGEMLYEYNGRELGTFESLFGTEDTAVNMYWYIQGSDLNPFTSGTTLNQFYWNDSPPDSQVTVFGVNGQVLSTSVTAAVPEPETFAMFMAGLGLMGFASRRKKA